MKEFQKNYIKKVETLIRTNYNVSTEVATFIACQFALESDYGTSNLAVNRNNHCGMKNPLLRPSTAAMAGVSNEHTFFAEFISLEMCIVDYFLCLAFHKPMKCDMLNIENFATFIRWYCPAKDYADRIKKIYFQFKEAISRPAG